MKWKVGSAFRGWECKEGVLEVLYHLGVSVKDVYTLRGGDRETEAR